MILIKNIDRMHQKNSKSKLIGLIEEERKKRAALDKNQTEKNENHNEIQILPNTSVTSNQSRLKTAILRGFSSTRKETQAQKTLSIVLVVFIVSYFPIFTFITVTSVVDFIRSKKSSTNFDSGEISKNFNYTLNNTYLLNSFHEFPISSNTTSSFQDFFQTDKILKTNILDRIFYSTTWIGYSSAALNPAIHLFLNSNFRTALINCFSFR